MLPARAPGAIPSEHPTSKDDVCSRSAYSIHIGTMEEYPPPPNIPDGVPDEENGSRPTQSLGEDWKDLKIYFFVALMLSLCIGFYAFIPLCFYEPLQESPRKRKYYIYGCVTGICLLAVASGISIAVWYLLVYKAFSNVN